MKTIKKGNKEVESSRFRAALYHNLSPDIKLGYFSKYKVDDKYLEGFRKTLDSFIDKLDSGEYSIDESGRIVDSTGLLDPYNNLNKQVTHYINFAFDNSPAYVDPEAAKKLKYSSESGISNALNLILFSRDSFNNDFLYLDLYDEKTKKRGHKERARMMSEALLKIRTNPDLYYSNLKDADRTSILSSIDNLISKLDDGDLSDLDRMYATNLGIDPDLYLYSGQKYAIGDESEESVDDGLLEMSELDKLVYEDLKTLQEEQKRDAMAGYNIYKLYRLLPNSGVTYTIGSSTDALNSYYNGIRLPRLLIGNTLKFLYDVKANPNNPIYTFYLKMNADSNFIYNILKNPALLDSLYNLTPFLGRRWTLTNSLTNQLRKMFNGMTNKLVLSLLLSNLTTGGDSNYSPEVFQNDLGISEAVIGTGSKSGYILTYNPNTGLISERRVVDLPEDLLGRINEQLGTYLQYRQARTTPLEKDGGVIKALFGAKLSHKGPSYSDTIKEKQEAQTTNEITKAGDRDLESYRAGLRKIQSFDDFTAVEWIRLGTAAADIVGAISSFAPGIGTATSATSGIVSTAGNMAADMMDDSVSGLEVLKNFVINVGLSAVSLIPGGGFTKLSRTVKDMKNILIPAIGIASSMGLFTDEKVINSLKKAVSDPTNLTVDDWKNVGYGLSAIAGLSRTGSSAIKSRTYKKYRAKEVPTDNFKVKTDSGNEYTLKAKDINEINEVGKRDGLDAANKLFKTKTGATEDLPSIVNYKTKGLFKNRRSNLLEGENVTKSSMSPEDANVANMRKIYNDSKVLNGKLDRSGIYKLFNTDYEVFVEGKSPIRWPSIPAFNFMSSKEKAWRDNYRRNHPLNNTLNNTLNSLPANSYIDLSFASFRPKNTKIIDLRNLNLSKLKIDRFVLINDKNRYKASYLDKYLNKYKLPKPANKPLGLIFKLGKDKSGKLINAIYLFKGGGTLNRATNIVLKFAGGGVPTYWDALWSLKSLKGWKEGLRLDNIGATAKNEKHYHAGNLDMAYLVNNAYTLNKDLVGKDINTYYSNKANGMSAQDFVKLYNNNIINLDAHFNRGNLTYKLKTAGDHNRLFREMYNLRSGAGTDAWDIGYDPKLDNIEGSSTWLRRVDKYDTVFNLLSDNLKRNRIHKVGDFYVYKENDGTIGLLDNTEAERLLNYQEPALEDVKIELVLPTSVEGQNGLEENPLDLIDVSKLNLWNLLNQGSRLARLLAGWRTNRINRDDLIEAYSRPAYLRPKLWQSPVYEGYSELKRGENEAANIEKITRDTLLSDPSLITAILLDGALKAAAIRERAAAESDKINLASRLEAKIRDEKSMESRVDTNNANSLINLKARELLALVLNDYHTRQYEILSNYLVELENLRNQNISDLRKQALSTAEKIAELNTNYKTKAAYNLYMDAYSRDPNSEETKIAYDNYLKEVNNATIDAFNLTNDTVARVMGWPGYTYRNPETIFYLP